MGARHVNFECKGKMYPFYYDPKRTQTNINGSKTLYFGTFKNEAPENLSVDTTYCLKLITIQNPAVERCAAMRDCYDLLDFAGAHLRQILARNDDAERAARTLKEHNTCEVCVCMVIEPCYKSLEGYFLNCGDYTARDRLDIVRQFAEGSRELSDPVNRIDGRSVGAHRDLKWENGVQDSGEAGIHIRLVDFATVWLEGTRVTGTQVMRGTKPWVLSPENTSPESVMQMGKLSEKTDVYALGMMLASLFVRCGGKYVNPSKLWCEEYGWGNNEETPTLRKQMQRCQEMYDQNDSFPSWIERDLLKEHGRSLEWGTDQDPKIMEQIRKLFQQATRIDPDKRINRYGFIKRLEEIIRQLDSRTTVTERTPVSVYLFDAAGGDAYRQQYLAAAADAFRGESEAAKQNGGTAPCALCVSYRSPLSGDRRSECLELLTTPPAGGEKELCSGIEHIQPARAGEGDLLLYAIYKAYDYLCARKERYRFTGNVYLFCPRIPAETELVPFSTEACDYDMESMLSVTLNTLRQGQTYLYAFTGKEPTSRDMDWCDYELFAPETTVASDPDTASGASRGNGDLFDVRETALFVTMPNGERMYVSIRKD